MTMISHAGSGPKIGARPRVIPYANETGAKFYGGTPRGLRWLPQRAQVGLNKLWLYVKVKLRYNVEDIGAPRADPPLKPSPYYDGEHEVLAKLGYPRYTRIDRGD